MRRPAVCTLALATIVTSFACAHEPSSPPAEPEVAPVATVTSATTPTPEPAPIEEAPEPQGDGRLPGTATPLHYAIELDVDPAQQRFHGTTSIDVEIPRATSHVVLHGRALNVTDVGATFGSKALGGTSITRLAHGGVEPDELVLIFPEPLAAGRATISVTYDAPFVGSPGTELEFAL